MILRRAPRSPQCKLWYNRLLDTRLLNNRLLIEHQCDSVLKHFVYFYLHILGHLRNAFNLDVRPLNLIIQNNLILLARFSNFALALHIDHEFIRTLLQINVWNNIRLLIL
jgi:hypothetical protein